MTHTLTTERLREIAERRSPSLRWGEAEQIAAELLANREAQPVAWVTMQPEFCDDERTAITNKIEADKYSLTCYDLTPLYTAPPAPAVEAELDYSRRRIAELEDMIDTPPAVVNPAFTGAPAVPDERDAFDAWFASDYSPDKSGNSSMGERVFKGVPWHVWQARAMLAQPVSQGYKLVPVELLSTASSLIDLCRTHTTLSGNDYYKERTLNECNNTMDAIAKLVAAAPEDANNG
ncbi:hypothetical protein [Serratia quinivorans]|uniref:hypothetical protein n=1 Tax=Serratia quinivorans TaxID=137545 RepID=UPI003F99C211